MNIKNHGLKTTKARKGIINLLARTTRPIDAVEAQNILENKGLAVDQATVYRSLNTFSKKGLVKEIFFHDGVIRYEIVGKPEHHHAVCVKCNKVEDIMDCSVEKIEEQISKKKGFTVMNHSLEFFGICKDCKAKKS